MELQGDAGFNPDGVFSSMWAKALFDMSAFVLVPGGDSNIRTIQQQLNKAYHDYFGILPCDGTYQRDTNTALIYALQAEEGMGIDEANGIYGPGTTSRTPVLSPGDDNKFVTILGYGLYVNGFYQDHDFIPNKPDTLFTSEMESAVVEYKRFMALGQGPVTGIADLSVMKGLLSSAGDTDRPASGADTATQLTKEHIQTLVDEKVTVVGRYLTGSVGTGDDKRDKFLTIEELQNLFEAGISVFPIYQDGGWYEEYFTSEQGSTDAKIAGQTAYDLGIPVGTTVYFAVDVDVQDGNIPGTIIPYFNSVFLSLKDYRYEVGVYGTRNVCSRVIEEGFAINAFVSDMSTGFSGNLGFKMPKEWSFDQFVELSIGIGAGQLDIDRVAVSGRDYGFSSFEDTKLQEIRKKFLAIGDIIPILKGPALGTVSFDHEEMIPYGPYHIYVKLEESAEGDDGPTAINIENGKISTKLTDQLKTFYGDIVLPIEQQKIDFYNKIAEKIQTGSITVTQAKRDIEPDFGIKTVYEFKPNDGTKISTKWTIEVYLRRNTVSEMQPDDMEAFENLLKLTGHVTNSNEAADLVRMFETFLSMTVQPPAVTCLTIEVGGMIATFALEMLLVTIL